MDTSAPTTQAGSEQLLPGQRFIPDLVRQVGEYTLRFARTAADLDAVCRLRFQIFNLELGEGLTESFSTGRDEDRFDAQCQHLMVIHRPNAEVVGTYRLQVAPNAQAGIGFYSAGEFDLSGIPEDVLLQSVELGRACVARPHRSTKVLLLLWNGLVEYGLYNGMRHFFGCSSLTSQDPAEGLRCYAQLQSAGHIHPTWRVEPLPEMTCQVSGAWEAGPAVKIPTLFQIYLKHGAYVLGPPAIDRQFGTIDYITWMILDRHIVESFGRR
ncbi:MAG: GNAT family N-acyltransferase [Planctomycetota bacterium]